VTAGQGPRVAALLDAATVGNARHPGVEVAIQDNALATPQGLVDRLRVRYVLRRGKLVPANDVGLR
jgi:hypothetical protein